jgi:phage I-like protein
MVAAHQIAVADGITPDSDRYFESVEGVLGISGAPQPRSGNRAPPAAPVSRSGSGTGGSGNTVTLSAQEREMAQMMGMSVKEYAANKLALKREGKMN